MAQNGQAGAALPGPVQGAQEEKKAPKQQAMLRDFSQRLEALRKNIEMFDPHLEGLEKENADHVDKLTDHLKQAINSEPIYVAKKIDETTLAQEGDVLGIDEMNADTKTASPEASGNPEDTANIASSETISPQEPFSDRHGLHAIKLKKMVDALDPLIAAIKRHSVSYEQRQILYTSSLVTLVSEIDALISSYLQFFYEKNPTAISKNDDPRISISEIIQLKDISAIIQNEIEKEVTSTMYGGWKEWEALLKNKLSLSLNLLSGYLDDVTEIFLRRNLVVHNRGVVNSLYLSKLPKSCSPKDKGTRILIDKEYLGRATAVLETVGILIVIEAWHKHDSSGFEEWGQKFLVDLPVEYIEKGHFIQGRELSRFLMKLSSLDYASKLRAKFNYWQTFKWCGEFDEVKNDVENFDCSALDVAFRLARFALLDRESDFFGTLEGTDKRSISTESLKEWPIFQGMRKSELFAAAISKREKLTEIASSEGG